MPRYEVTISFTKKIKVFAADEEAAEDKAVETVLKWEGVLEAEALSAEETD